MNKKIKKEMKRLDKKRRNERLMAMAIAGGILVSNTPSSIVNAEGLDSEIESNVLATNGPEIDFKYIEYYKSSGEDIFLPIKNFNGCTLDHLILEGEIIVPSEYVTVVDSGIVLSKDYLDFIGMSNNSKVTFSGKFSNGGVYDIARFVYYKFDFGGGTNPPSDEVVSKPTIEAQDIHYIKSLGKGAIINGVNAKGVTVDSVSFGEYTLISDHLDFDADAGYILLEDYALKYLDVKDGIYSVSVKFSDGTVINSGLTLHVNQYSASSPDDTPEENNTPTFKYNKLNPTDIVLPNDDYKDKEIDTVYFEGLSFPITGADSDLIKVVDGHVVLTPAALEAVGVDSRLYNYTVEYKDYTTSVHSFNLEVVEESEIVPPAEDNKPGVNPPAGDNKPGNGNTTPPSEDVKDEVVFDKNNPKDLEIPGLAVGTELVDSVIINGEEFDVEYKTSLARTNTKPAVHIVDGKLVVPVAVLEYLGLDSESLNITVNLANGQVLSKVVNLSVKDSADKEEDKEEDNDDSNNGPSNGTSKPNENGSSNGTSKPNENGPSNGTSKPNGNSNNGNSNNGNSNNVNSSNGTSKPNGNSTNGNSTGNNSTNGNASNGNAQTQLPNTGAPVSAGLIGSIITTVGVLLNRKRK